MERERKSRVTFYFSLALIMIGFLSGRFMIIKENRIVDGMVVDTLNALGENSFLLALLFLILGVVIIFYTKGVAINPIWITLIGVGLFIALVVFSGVAATYELLDMGSTARASVGLGFWFMIVGVLLLIQQSVKLYATNQERISLLILLSTFFILYWIYRLGWLSSISIVREVSDRWDLFSEAIIQHLQLSIASSLSGLGISIILSYAAYRKQLINRAVSIIANASQVIPTLSLLGLLMIPLGILAQQYPGLKALGISGIGFFPAYLVLTLYTLLPITSNAIAGFRSINQNVIQAAEGMGMSRRQILKHVEGPLAIPAIAVGFRTALIQTVGNGILAGLVGGGGLGTILFLGLAQSAPDLVLASALLVVMVAVLLDILMIGIENSLRKKYRGEFNRDRIKEYS